LNLRPGSLNTNFNIVSSAHNTTDFDPCKSINLKSAGNLNNDFSNSKNNNFNEGSQAEIINNTMNLDISVIKPNENESDNYPEFHQLNRDSFISHNNPSNGINLSNPGNANNFDPNFNDFNDAQNFNNQINNFNLQNNINVFPDKEEFDF